MKHLGKIFVLFVGASVMIAMALFSQTRESQNIEQTNTTSQPKLETRSTEEVPIPQFAAFPISKFTQHTDREPAEIQFDLYPAAEEFKDILVAAASSSPNFAGVYAIATWSCENDEPTCEQSAIIHPGSGRIIAFGIVSHAGLAYQRDSTLLVVNPQEALPQAQASSTTPVSTDYYLFENDRLSFLFKQNRQGEPVRTCPEIRIQATNVATGATSEFASSCVVPSGWNIN